MSQLSIQKYLNDLSKLKKVSGTARESVVREAFKDLIKTMGRGRDLVFIPEHLIVTKTGAKIYVDGALVYDVRLAFGYWEAKDQEDDLDKEIEKKFAKGYPQDNILFENSTTAVLIQNGREAMRCSVLDTERLEALLDAFFAYQRPEIAEFRKAVAQFQKDLPSVLKALREMIESAQATNKAFRAGAAKFLKHAQESINPAVTAEDVREMLIQHILTEEIFSKVFDDDEFHRKNNVARELYALEELFFVGALKKNTMKALESYYNAIRATAHQISSHNERQKFLKIIYEGFYKVYNPKAADRLGVVYTPQEIVRFMIQSADWLCQKHFGKSLIDRGVEILDPATGTGTYICELLEHFSGQPAKLAHKYKEELHANEVAILPYYVANLNIEATYAAIAGQYAEFPNLCFVDTLDNVAPLGVHSGHQYDLFGAVSEENVARIKRQNARKISVIIGNPPYNANQQNENDNNKNRTYPRIDERIKATYIKESTAQKTKAYDMYTRFFRWASDRLRDEGIVAFITNRSFIDSRTMDGFRRCVARDFAEAWVVDLGGDVRANPKLSGTKHNVFGIQTGVAVSFLVRKKAAEECRIFYARRPEMETREEKLEWISVQRAPLLGLAESRADASANWLEFAKSDFDQLVPTVSKYGQKGLRTIFSIGANAIKTNRDEWVFDSSFENLKSKSKYLVSKFNVQISKGTKESSALDYSIKWSSGLKSARMRVEFRELSIVPAIWRPFVAKNFFSEKTFNDRLTDFHFRFFGRALNCKNPTILFVFGGRLPFTTFSVNQPVSYSLLSLDPVYCVPLYQFASDGTRIDNITDWALAQFRTHYGKPEPSSLAGARSRRPTGRAANGQKGHAGVRGGNPSSGPSGPLLPQGEKVITKDDIFHYVYAVLHDPIYRETYAQNLKREFPRIPFYPDFWTWTGWGERLMALHIGYESVAPWPLLRIDTPDAKARAAGRAPKPALKSDPAAGAITLDSETQLTGVPASAWSYRLGNRSALDWILDQHKEKTPKDPTIREKFNTYRFADYKEKVVDLLMRVTRVSVETMEIVEAMRGKAR